MGSHRGKKSSHAATGQSKINEYRDTRTSGRRPQSTSGDYKGVKGLKSYIKNEMDLLMEDLLMEMGRMLDQKLDQHLKTNSERTRVKSQETGGLAVEMKSLKTEVTKLGRQSRNMFAMLNLMRVLGDKVKTKKRHKERRRRKVGRATVQRRRNPDLENSSFPDSESSTSSSESSSDEESSDGSYVRKKGTAANVFITIFNQRTNGLFTLSDTENKIETNAENDTNGFHCNMQNTSHCTETNNNTDSH